MEIPNTLQHFSNVTEPAKLQTDKHSYRLLAAYQVLCDEGYFTEVEVLKVPLERFRNLYPALIGEIQVAERNGSLIVTPNELNND